MPRLDGIDAIKQIRARCPGTRILVLTSFADDRTVLPAVRAGAAGYLLKDVQPPELVAAIRTVHSGEALLAPAVATMLVEQLAAEDGANGTAGESAAGSHPAPPQVPG